MFIDVSRVSTVPVSSYLFCFLAAFIVLIYRTSFSNQIVLVFLYVP